MKWKVVIQWATKGIEFLEKETNGEFDSIRDRILYLLTNAYLKNHEEANSIVCLQLCSNPNAIQVQYLYVLYYIAIKNISVCLINSIL